MHYKSYNQPFSGGKDNSYIQNGIIFRGKTAQLLEGSNLIGKHETQSLFWVHFGSKNSSLKGIQRNFFITVSCWYFSAPLRFSSSPYKFCDLLCSYTPLLARWQILLQFAHVWSKPWNWCDTKKCDNMMGVDISYDCLTPWCQIAANARWGWTQGSQGEIRIGKDWLIHFGVVKELSVVWIQ